MTMAPETAMTIQRLLLGGLLLAGGWYVARIAAAVLLLALSRFRPGFAGAAQRCAPATLRPLIRRAVVTGLVGATLSGTGAWAAVDNGCESGPDVLLDRGQVCATDPTTPPLPSTDPPPTAAPAHYLVQPGDSLWRIASTLRPEADSAVVADVWPLLWQANLDVIGDDPGLIRPGTALTVPTGVTP